ncbi:hypothetical protein C4565_09525 [Candidatus Parcubacteria bacterium]|nr:MAG: hypothetical protein C4565_09525 [Candidatus Parcubacteria bacterium]
MSHQLTKFLILALLFLTLPQPAHSYWLENKLEPFSLRERQNAPPSKEKNYFTIQDNFELFLNDTDAVPLLLPNTDYFVPADIIDINLPLFGIFSHPTTPAEDPFANMLYANLKLKKILEEYAAIQKSAQKLLDREFTYTNQSTKQTTSPFYSNQIQQSQSHPSQQSKQSSLQSIYSSLMDLNRAASLTQKQSYEYHTTNIENTIQNITIPNRKLNQPNKLETSSKTNTPAPISNTFSYLYKINLPDTSGNHSQRENENTKESRPSSPRGDYGQLEKIILKIRDYIIKNKIECIIYGIIFLILINVFSFIIHAIFSSKKH